MMFITGQKALFPPKSFENYPAYVAYGRGNKRKYVISKMDLANTFKGQKSAVILYSQCDATVRSQQRHPILKDQKSNPNQKPNPNPILSKNHRHPILETVN